MSRHCQGIETVKQPGELPGVNGKHLRLAGWPAKHMPLQTLVPQTNAVAIPVEQLDGGPAAVAKAEKVTGGWIECEPVDRPSGCSDPREKLVSLLPLGPKLAGGLPA